MATREELHREVDALPEDEIARARLVVDGDGERNGDIVGLPRAWGRTATGEPMPNVVAAVRRSRNEH